MNYQPTLKQFLLSLFIAILLLIPYELYFANVEHYPRSQDVESLDLWADWRAKVDKLSENDILIYGSSRAHFDINIHLWESITGQRPVMLAYPGSSPYHPIEDIVDNSEFKGILLIGISPGLFFTMHDTWGAGRGKSFVDHYYKRTYAQKFNNFLFKFIDPLFAYLDPSLNYVSLIERIPITDRDSVRHPPVWPPMVDMDKYRNIRMIPEMETDTILQRRQTEIWDRPVWKNRFADSVDVIMKHYVSHLNAFKDRGGRVAFLRPPVTGQYLKHEPVIFPREEYWERILRETNSPGFHFQDNEETNVMVPPEWSHLNRKDSDRYTELVIDFLKTEKIIE